MVGQVMCGSTVGAITNSNGRYKEHNRFNMQYGSIRIIVRLRTAVPGPATYAQYAPAPWQRHARCRRLHRRLPQRQQQRAGGQQLAAQQQLQAGGGVGLRLVALAEAGRAGEEEGAVGESERETGERLTVQTV